MRNILNYHHKLDNDVKKKCDFSIKIIRAAILIVVKRKCRTFLQGGRIGWYVFVMLQISEVIVQVAWVWEHRSTSMPLPPAWTMIRTGNLCGQRFPDTCISTTRTDLYPGRHGVTRYSTTARRFRYTCYICDHNTGARVFSNSVRLSRDWIIAADTTSAV